MLFLRCLPTKGPSMSTSNLDIDLITDPALSRVNTFFLYWHTSYDIIGLDLQRDFQEKSIRSNATRRLLEPLFSQPLASAVVGV